MMLCGNAGTGKSTIVESIFDTENILYIKLDCNHFQSIKQLFHSLQYETSVILQANLSQKRKRASNKQQAIHSYYTLPCFTLLEYHTFIKGLFSIPMIQELNITLVFDHIEVVQDYLESDAMLNLLAIQEVSEYNTTNNCNEQRHEDATITTLN